MSEQQIVDASGNPIPEEDLPKTEEVQEPEVDQEPGEDTPEALPEGLPQVSCGYVVGLGPDDKLVFEVLGEDAGLVQLLGLHQYAQHRLTVATEMNQNYGTPLVLQQMGQLAQMLKVMLNMLTNNAKQNIVQP